MKKKSKIILGVVIIIIILLLVIGTWFLIKNTQNKEVNNTTTITEGTENNSEKLNEEQTSKENSNENSNKKQTSKENNNGKANSIAGLYKYEKDFQDENQNMMVYYLYLYDDGTFKYEHYGLAAQGEIGQYTINGHNLTLNIQYLTGSDVGLSTSKETRNLKINDDGTITDNNNYLSYEDFPGLDKKYKDIIFGAITMKKASESESNEYKKNTPSIQETINQAKSINAIEQNQINHGKYKGYWSNENTNGNELTITKIDDKSVDFSWLIYRQRNYDISASFINENKATFTAMEYGNDDSSKISGIITFRDNSITIVVVESADARVEVGYTDTYLIE